MKDKNSYFQHQWNKNCQKIVNKHIFTRFSSDETDLFWFPRNNPTQLAAKQHLTITSTRILVKKENENIFTP